MSTKFGGSSPYAAASSMARQRHMAPPKIEATLSSTNVTTRHALEKLCTFLQTEASKLSHIDLQQQHWVDVHGVATTLCHDEQQLVKRRERQEQSSGDGSDNIKKSKELKEVNRYHQKLERMMDNVDALGSGGTGRGGVAAMSPSSPMSAKHIVFDDVGADDGTPRNDNCRHDATSSQNEEGDDRESKKRAKKEKKRQEKKAAKRERKEAKKKLKREAREGSEKR